MVKLINRKNFAKTALDENSEIFVVHVTALEAMLIYLFKASQVQDGTTMVAL